MAINLYSDYGGFYNNYKVVDIPKVDLEAVSKQEEVKKIEENASMAMQVPALEKPEEALDTRSRIADLDNISLNFNSGDDYSYIGSDFEIEKLDIQKAISDMKKDKILEDYQFFVGDKDEMKNTFKDEDGAVFLKF
ncbi:MAG: hypothetical protein IK068_01305 [Lachnospiraceae bacterium]|nr:hypothetical protein [Lachnospiraceae bacterium]